MSGVPGDAAGRRFLIAAGSDRFEHLPADASLPNARTDVAEIERLFTGFGYEPALPGLADYASAEHIKRKLSHWSRDTGLNEHDVVALYWAGHGIVEERDRHYLCCWDTRLDDLPASALPTEDVVRVLTNGGARNLMMIIDTCYGAAGAVDATRSALQALSRRLSAGTARTGIWFVSAARVKDEAEDGAFVDALHPAVGTVTGRTGQRQPYLDLAELVGAVNDVFATKELRQRAELWASLSTGPAPFLPNTGFRDGLPPVGTDLETQDRAAQRNDLREHFGPRGRGVEFESEQGVYFNGRERAIAELVGWLTARTGDGKGRVVTGNPGCGKSAVLGRIVGMSDPLLRRELRLEDTPTHLVMPENAVQVAVHARHKRLENVVRQIAVNLDLTVDGTADLLQAIRRRAQDGHTIVVVVDALDEAGSGTAADTEGRGEPRRIARELLRPLSEIAGVRLLVGTRRPLVSSLGTAMVEVDLDRTGYLGNDDIARYVHQVLLAADQPETPTPYRGHEQLAWTVAQAVARRAARVFLVARMTARSLRSMPEPVDVNRPGWVEALPSEIGEAFDDYLTRFGAEEDRVRALLTPLAFAEGRGIPRGALWLRIAEALSGTEHSEEDIAWVLKKAGAYIAEVTEGDHSVYRLYHQALAEHLRATWRLPAVETQQRIVDALVAERPHRADGRQPDWFTAPAYVRSYLATHAATAGRLDQLVTDPGFLLVAEQVALVQALQWVASEGAKQVRNAYEQVAHQLVADRPLEERAAYLQLSARRCGADDLADRIDDLGLPMRWSSRWAWWSRTGVHRQLSGHDGPVSTVAVTELDDRTVVVTGGLDGTIRLWDLTTQQQIGQPLATPDESSVRALALGELEERSIAVSGHRDGAVRVWDLSTGQVLGAPLLGHTNTVSAVAISQVAGRTIAVSASFDGTARVWELAARTQVGQPLIGHLSDIHAVAVGEFDGQQLVITGGDDSKAYVWDLATQQQFGQPLLGHTGRVTAVAVGTLADQTVVVTGGGDGTVRVWDLATRQQSGEPITVDRYGIGALALGTLNGAPVAITACHSAPVVRVWDLRTRQQASAPLSGHTDEISSVAFQLVRDRPVVITGSLDGTARIWELTADRASTEHGHTSSVGAAAIGEVDGRPVAVTGSNDTTALVWDLRSRQQHGPPLHHHTDAVTAVALGHLHGRPVAVTGSADATARVWDLRTHQPLGRPFRGHTNRIRGVSLTRARDRPVLVTGSDDGTVRVWDPGTQQQLGAPLTGDNDRITMLDTGPLGDRTVLVAGSASSVRVWDLASRQLLAEPFERFPDRSRVIVVSCAGGRPAVLLAGNNNVARWYDVLRREPIGEPHTGHTDQILAGVVADIDGRSLTLTRGYEQSVRVWAVDTGRLAGPPLTGHPSRVDSAALGTMDGRPVALTCSDEYIRLWDLHTFEPVGEPMIGNITGLSGIGVTRLGDRPIMVTAGDDTAIRVMDLQTGHQAPPILAGHGRPTQTITVGDDSDGVLATLVSADGRIRVWDLAKRQELGQFTPPSRWLLGVQVVATSNIRGRLLTVTGDGSVAYVWDLRDRIQLGPPLTGHTADIWSAALGELASGPVAFTGSRDGTARLWDLTTGHRIGEPLTGHEGDVGVVTLLGLRGRALLLTGDDTGILRTWDAETHEHLGQHPTGHDRPLAAAVPGTVGNRTILGTATFGGMLDVWDLESWALLARIQLAADVRGLAFGPDSFLCVTTNMGALAFQLQV